MMCGFNVWNPKKLTGSRPPKKPPTPTTTMNTYYIIQEDMDYNNFEIRGISTDFKEAANVFQSYVDIGKRTMFELIKIVETGGRVIEKEVLRSTS